MTAYHDRLEAGYYTAGKKKTAAKVEQPKPDQATPTTTTTPTNKQ